MKAAIKLGSLHDNGLVHKNVSLGSIKFYQTVNQELVLKLEDPPLGKN